MLRNLTVDDEEIGEFDTDVYAGPTEFFSFGDTALRDVIAEIMFDGEKMASVAFSRDRRWALGVPEATAADVREHPDDELHDEAWGVRIGEVPPPIAKKLRRSSGSAQIEMQRAAKHEAAAQLLDAYISFRARHEGVGYELNPKFFLGGLHGGCRSFFGVTVGDDGQLLKDEQFPEYFASWQQQKHLN
jgi:hypothetical protein